jgi:hypothetical protein
VFFEVSLIEREFGWDKEGIGAVLLFLWVKGCKNKKEVEFLLILLSDVDTLLPDSLFVYGMVFAMISPWSDTELNVSL